MQVRTVLLLCAVFVLGFARPQGNAVDGSGSFGGQPGASGGGVGPQMGPQQRLQKFRGILAGKSINKLDKSLVL